MPEEINRVVADHVSTLLFCPTATAVANLAAEGVAEGVHAVGDVMFDATLAATARAGVSSTILARLSLEAEVLRRRDRPSRGEHRRSPALSRKLSAGSPTRRSRQPVVMPIHPRTARLPMAAGLQSAGVILIEPLGYLDMTQLVHNAAAVFTNSGGLQKEAYFHRVACVTLRNETEWVETIEAGWNRLWTTAEFRPRREIPDYGDGRAADAIASLLAATL